MPSTELTITKKMSVELPDLPKFLMVTEGIGENGLRREKVLIKDFTIEQLKQIGGAWTAALVDAATAQSQE